MQHSILHETFQKVIFDQKHYLSGILHHYHGHINPAWLPDSGHKSLLFLHLHIHILLDELRHKQE